MAIQSDIWDHPAGNLADLLYLGSGCCQQLNVTENCGVIIGRIV
ncbi:MAG: hypothetical protein ABSG68_15890 [Thermoguttaceae bacterium]|jgi:hypothetical protein